MKARQMVHAPVMANNGEKTRVLFVCIGNSCRSPIALGFARKYGADVMVSESAGVYPINRVDPASIRIMQERNIDISDAYPKGLEDVNVNSFDWIINMSGQRLQSAKGRVEDWVVPDPITKSDEDFRSTADLLEQLVMRLILQLRLRNHPALVASR